MNNNTSSVFIACISFFLIILLIIGMFIFAFFPVQNKDLTTDYDFVISFDNGTVLSYEEMTGIDYYLKYRNYNNEGYIIISYYTELSKDKYYSFTLNSPVLCLVYKSNQYFSTETLFYDWYFNHNVLSLTRAQYVYGCLLPQSYYKNLNDAATNHNDDFTIFDYFIENGHYPYYYKISSLNFDSFSIYRDGVPTIQFAENSNLSYNVLFNSYNIFSSSLYTFNEGINELDFPHLDWHFNNISDLFDLFSALTNYIDDLVLYFSNIISSFIYGFSPLLWYQ